MASTEEGVPPPTRAELAALAPRALKARARQCGVTATRLGQALLQDEDDLLDAKEALIVLCLARFAPTAVVKVPVDHPATGHALGKYLAMSNAKLAVVSTPEFGPTTPGEPPFDVPVMAALERASGYAGGALVGAYDFAGSASAQDCRAQIPDKDLRRYLGEEHHTWDDPEAIKQVSCFAC